MKRIMLWALSTISALVLLLGYSTSTSGPLATSESTSVQSGSYSASAATGTSSGTGSGTTSSGSSGTGTGTTSGTTGSTSGSSSTSTPAKTVSGSVAQTRWGPVQVQITVASGKVTKVSVLEYPSGNGKDQEINSYALPILTQETIDAQSASIDMVSGATVTSGGYLESLQSALDRAAL